MKYQAIRVLLHPTVWDTSPSMSYPSSILPVPIYTPRWRGTMWSIVLGNSTAMKIPPTILITDPPFLSNVWRANTRPSRLHAPETEHGFPKDQRSIPTQIFPGDNHFSRVDNQFTIAHFTFTSHFISFKFESCSAIAVETSFSVIAHMFTSSVSQVAFVFVWNKKGLGKNLSIF